jgi:hypothetical protein
MQQRWPHLYCLLIDPAAIEDSSFQMTFAAVIAMLAIGLPVTQWIFETWNLRLRQFDNVDRDGRLDPDIADWRVSRRMWCERYGLPSFVITAPFRLIQILAEAFVATLAVEAVFIYFMVESFHRVAPVAPILNVPAGLIAAAITPLGLLLMVLPQVLAAPVAVLVRLLVRILLWTLQAGLEIPHSSFRVPSAPLGVWLLYAAILVLLVRSLYRKRRLQCVAGIVLAIGTLSVITVVDFSPSPPHDIVVTFLDVGQGDSILLEFPTAEEC